MSQHDHLHRSDGPASVVAHWAALCKLVACFRPHSANACTTAGAYQGNEPQQIQFWYRRMSSMYMHEAEPQLDVRCACTAGMHMTTLLLYLGVSKRQGSTAVVPGCQQKTTQHCCCCLLSAKSKVAGKVLTCILRTECQHRQAAASAPHSASPLLMI